MKNQNDLIFMIVFAVIAVGSILAFVFTAPKPITLPAPTAVPTDRVPVAQGAVVKANSLPGGSATGGAFGGAGGGRRGGSRAGLGGPAAGGPGGGPAGPTLTGASGQR